MLISRETISKVAFELKLNSKKIVFTNGCFDVIHSGHVHYLTEAKKLGDILVVGLNTDDSVKRLKGKDRPINHQLDRAAVLGALKPVDFVVYFDEDTPLELIKIINPDVLVKGADYKIEDIVGADFVQTNGGQVITIGFIEGKSSTSLIKKMKL